MVSCWSFRANRRVYGDAVKILNNNTELYVIRVSACIFWKKKKVSQLWQNCEALIMIPWVQEYLAYYTYLKLVVSIYAKWRIQDSLLGGFVFLGRELFIPKGASAARPYCALGGGWGGLNVQRRRTISELGYIECPPRENS